MAQDENTAEALRSILARVIDPKCYVELNSTTSSWRKT